MNRCLWVGDTQLMIDYHDTEWGTPLYDDAKLFEYLCLESFQAGLSWNIVLKKREALRSAFLQFDPIKIAQFGKREIDNLLVNVEIIRNKAKILATINNALRFLEVKKEFGRFSTYQWKFVNNKPISHNISVTSDYLTTIPKAINFAKDLKKRGFKFLGPTTIYAHMQATGMVNDHMVGCYRRNCGFS